MSDFARRTDVMIRFDGVDITKDIKPYFLSLTYTDNEEDTPDDIQITLQDRDGIWLEKWLTDVMNADAAPEASETAAAGSGTLEIGAVVNFTGNRHYVSSTSDKGYNTKSGPGRITAINQGAKHPYHLIHTDSTTNRYGWVNEADIAEAGAASAEASFSTEARLKISADIIPKHWGKDGVLPTGAHELDRIDASGPPSKITIRATSLPFTAGIRQTKKDKAWESYTLSGIAKEIAGNGSMGCIYLSSKDPYFDRVEQVKTSDMDFLLELCHNAGLSLKASDGNIVLFDQADFEANPPVLTLTKGGGGYETYKLSTGSANTQYASCHVRYLDPGTGTLIEGYAEAEGEDAKSGQCLEISAKVADAGEANFLAAKQLRLRNKHERTAVFKLPGNIDLVAGVVVELKGFGAWNGLYIVKQARHIVNDSGGYTTQITLRCVLGGY